MPFDIYIDELRHTAEVASLNYEIWWIYKGKDRPIYIDVLRRYDMFFQTSIHAHFLAMIIALYRFFETRKDTINLPRLLKMAKENKLLSSSELAAVENDCAKSKAIWKKVSIIRNELFAHRSNIVGEPIIKANITYDEIRDLILMLKSIINQITHGINRNTHAFNISAEKDTRQLLADLKRLGEGR